MGCCLDDCWHFGTHWNSKGGRGYRARHLYTHFVIKLFSVKITKGIPFYNSLNFKRKPTHRYEQHQQRTHKPKYIYFRSDSGTWNTNREYGNNNNQITHIILAVRVAKRETNSVSCPFFSESWFKTRNQVIIEDAVRFDTAAPSIWGLGVWWLVSASGVWRIMLGVPLVDLVWSCVYLADLGRS